MIQYVTDGKNNARDLSMQDGHTLFTGNREDVLKIAAKCFGDAICRDNDYLPAYFQRANVYMALALLGRQKYEINKKWVDYAKADYQYVIDHGGKYINDELNIHGLSIERLAELNDYHYTHQDWQLTPGPTTKEE